MPPAGCGGDGREGRDWGDGRCETQDENETRRGKRLRKGGGFGIVGT